MNAVYTCKKICTNVYNFLLTVFKRYPYSNKESAMFCSLIFIEYSLYLKKNVD